MHLFMPSSVFSCITCAPYLFCAYAPVHAFQCIFMHSLPLCTYSALIFRISLLLILFFSLWLDFIMYYLFFQQGTQLASLQVVTTHPSVVWLSTGLSAWLMFALMQSMKIGLFAGCLFIHSLILQELRACYILILSLVPFFHPFIPLTVLWFMKITLRFDP